MLLHRPDRRCRSRASSSAASTGLAILGRARRRADLVQRRRPGAATTDSGPAPSGTVGEAIDAPAVFDGWGYAHLYDARTGEELDAFAIPEALDPRFADGLRRPLDPRVRHRSDREPGLQLLLLGRDPGAPLQPRRTGSSRWAPGSTTGARTSGASSSSPHRSGERLIAGSDRDYGLVILRYTGPGAAQAAVVLEQQREDEAAQTGGAGAELHGPQRQPAAAPDRQWPGQRDAGPDPGRLGAVHAQPRLPGHGRGSVRGQRRRGRQPAGHRLGHGPPAPATACG